MNPISVLMMKSVALSENPTFKSVNVKKKSKSYCAFLTARMVACLILLFTTSVIANAVALRPTRGDGTMSFE